MTYRVFYAAKNKPEDFYVRQTESPDVNPFNPVHPGFFQVYTSRVSDKECVRRFRRFVEHEIGYRISFPIVTQERGVL